MIRYLIEDESQLYTVSGGILVTVSGVLSASTFQSDGFTDLTGVSTLLQTLVSPKVYAWSDEQEYTVTSTIQGLPLPQDIIVHNQASVSEVVGVSEITATYTGTPLLAVSIDSGAYVCFNESTEQWEQAADHDGMTIPVAQAVPSSAWESLVTGMTTFELRVTLTAATDTVSEIVITFITN